MMTTHLYRNNSTGALVTVTELGRGITTFHPEGGGFVHEMPSEQFDREFTLHADAPKLQLTRVWMNDGYSIPAYVSDRRWNGWAMPYFTKDALMLALSTPAACLDNVRFDENVDAFVIRNEEDGDDVYPAEMVDIGNGVRVPMYAVGAGWWTWETAEHLGGYMVEFPRLGVLPEAEALIAAGWHDVSWHNDAAPSFESPTQTLLCWINPQAILEREHPEMPRFIVDRIEYHGETRERVGDDCIASGETLVDVLPALLRG